MKPRCLFPLSALVCILLPLALPSSVGAFCATEGPESVLTCLVEVYENRDIDSYEVLFSDDLVYQFGSDPGTSWGLAEELEAHRRMFTEPKIIDLRLQVNSYRVADGELPDTWVLEDVSVTMTVTEINPKDDEPLVLTAQEDDEVFYVRKALQPEVHYVIYKWISHAHE